MEKRGRKKMKDDIERLLQKIYAIEDELFEAMYKLFGLNGMICDSSYANRVLWSERINIALKYIDKAGEEIDKVKRELQRLERTST